MLEKQYHDELKMECEGIAFSSLSNIRAHNPPDAMKKDDTQSEHEEDANKQAEEDANKQAEKDAAEISKIVMPRSKRGLLRAMEVCIIYLIQFAFKFIDFILSIYHGH
jgi:pescadillo